MFVPSPIGAPCDTFVASTRDREATKPAEEEEEAQPKQIVRDGLGSIPLRPFPTTKVNKDGIEDAMENKYDDDTGSAKKEGDRTVEIR